jgi:hypothetical protein
MKRKPGQPHKGWKGSARAAVARSPRDGRPYYCVKCKLGFGEYMACDRADCKLESEESAEMRKLLVEANS